MSIFHSNNSSSSGPRKSIGSILSHSNGNIDSSSKSKFIIENIDDGVILIDSDFNINLINPSAATLCGWKSEDASGINIDLVLRLVNNKGEAQNNEQNPIHQVFSNGQSVNIRALELIGKDNKNVPISIHITPLLNSDKKVESAIVVISNIAKEKSNEKQSADFISTASHEMRTPVAAIEGYLALTLNDKVSTIDNRARGYLEKAHSSTQHLGKLFQDLLTSAKAEDGRLTSHPVVLEMGEFITNLTNDLRLVAEKKGLAVEYKGGHQNRISALGDAGSEKIINPLYFVFADPDRLREVISNLFDNALKYTNEGMITIGLTGNDTVVQCFVKDTGPGIPSEDLPHLFQKFYRVDNSTTRTVGGTGLGLFICAKIIELYNGRIWAESEMNKGSSFYINLPRLSSQKASQMLSVGHSEIPIIPTDPVAK